LNVKDANLVVNAYHGVGRSLKP